MGVRTVGRALACWMLVAAVACGEPARSSRSASLVGTWRSKEYLSQLGPTVVSYRFGADGSYSTETVLRALPSQPLSARGTYRAEGGRVTMTTGSQVSELSVEWDGDELVLTERNGDRYRLSRVGGG